MKQNIKIIKTIIPTEQMEYNDWCKEFKVSSRYINKKLFNMYYSTQAETNLFKRLIQNTYENISKI